MKRIFRHAATKTLVVILASLAFFTSAVSVLGIAWMLASGGYSSDFESLREEYLQERYSFLPEEVARSYHSSASFPAYLTYLKKEYNFSCTVANELGTPLYSDWNGEKAAVMIQERVNVWQVESEVFTAQGFISNPSAVLTVYQVTIYGALPEAGSDEAALLKGLSVVWELRYHAVAALGIGALLFLVFIVYLCCVSGKRYGDEEARCGFLDRIPTECYLGLLCLIFAVEFICLAVLSEESLLGVLILFAGIFLLLDSLLAVVSVMSLATRIKTGTLGSGTLTVRLIRFLFVCFRSLWENMRLVPKLALSLGAAAFLNLVLATIFRYRQYLVLLLLEGLVLTGILLWYGASLNRLQKDLEQISQGRLEHRCDWSRLPPGLKPLGMELNRSAEGMEKAVEEKMKSERFRSELITNVSHDIKTPLTSIINYVDLMKKEPVSNETVAEYLEILDRQSARLKKLTEDLVESSKASSGVLPVQMEPCDPRLLVEQALAEYQEAFEALGLTVCLQGEEKELRVMADGRHFWRVVDNLLTNVKKYALAGTRVYVNLEETEDRVRIVFRNISANALNLHGEDLAERFVRGDASRSSEGSGLGLAIAKSLMELQNGTLQITVDGDLFKVVLTLRKSIE